ncbi:protein-disulfide reductase DsbD domain-containing protein [Sphingobacterium athyrii]|uniref:Sugar transporter n=1 Tax=Sphingobacterium athyrii TaxID=2152717 RepID=A0A363NUW4_9SPHI|nr:protein-disulfide reductase DsbD domain-containing protein [Sphingobacterium athyrii]PUV24508.1 sugar transporter [Sphingobacterium athyrii]
MKCITLAILAIFCCFNVHAQILKPVKWTYAAKRTSNSEAIIYLKATIEDGWHIYSQFVDKGGPTRTSFNFVPSKNYKLIGTTLEPKPIITFEPNFNMNVGYFEKSVIFQQNIKLKTKTTQVKGSVEFMVCDDVQCLVAETVNFLINVK